MLMYPNIDPVAIQFGPLKVHWYGVMYLIGFVLAWALGLWRARQSHGHWNSEQVSDLIFYAAMGVIIGGRLGYVILYNPTYYLHDPAAILRVWDGGMAFHGGLVGVILGLGLFAKRYEKSWMEVLDFMGPLVPLGLAAGRLGNFINGELWGRITNVSWGMIFPEAGPMPRHPSQLYEFLLEGILLFIILWLYSNQKRPRGAVTGLFLLLYGLFRFFIEFFRQPDSQIGFVAFDWMTKGQLLCLLMVIVGIIIFFSSQQHKEIKK